MMKVLLKPSFVFCIFISVLFSFGCREKTAAWKGTITAENGVTVVRNPKVPMYGGDVLLLEEDMTIGEAAGEDDFLFSQIRSLAVDDAGHIYVLDSKENHVLVFDSAGQHLRTFGRAGQGPGEFRSPVTIGMTDHSEIAVEDFLSHLVFFSPEGEYIRNLPLTKTGVTRVSLDSDGNILGLVIMRDKDSPRYELQKFDPEMNLVQVLDSTPTPSASNEGFNPFMGSIYYAFDKDGQVVCGIPDRYEIKIFDTAGNLAKKITRDYDPVEITEEETKEVEEEMPPGMKLAIPKYHSAYQWLMTDDEGRIFVMTNERTPEGRGYFHDVFDPEGRYLAKIPLPSRPWLIKNNKFFTVTEDEKGFHVIKRYEARWKMEE